MRVTARVPGRPPELGEVRAEVARDWAAEQRQQAQQRFYEGLREGYEVEVHRPEAGTSEVASQP